MIEEMIDQMHNQ
jgi:hypothetical protein